MAAIPAHPLHLHPLHRAQDLGAAIPPSPHALSVALPTWDACIGYEEKAAWVVSALQAGYPRFVVHPLLQRLMNEVGQQQGWPAGSFTLCPSDLAAQRMADHLSTDGHGPCTIHDLGMARVHALVHPPTAASSVRACWQHAGMLPSTRQCEAALSGIADNPSLAREHGQNLRTLLGSWYGCPSDHIYLAANGMAAIAQTHRALTRLHPGLPTLQLGFPYVDLLKVQRVFGSGVIFIPGHDRNALDSALHHIAQESLAGVVVEVPGNPLLRTPDIAVLAEACRQARIPLVIDDSVASPLNVDLRGYADVVVHSLTKYVAGSGTVMGGASIVMPDSPWASLLAHGLANGDNDACWWQDLETLLAGARDYPQRIARINEQAAELVRRLRSHPAVAEVLYPDHCPHYAALKRPNGGYGGLCSLLLHHPEQRSPLVYDALAFCKGPSFGTTFTLVCPFTLLAHYDELEWAESQGVSRWLLRFSFGLEELEDSWRRLQTALDRVLMGPSPSTP